jgi:hypothetical protein
LGILVRIGIVAGIVRATVESCVPVPTPNLPSDAEAIDIGKRASENINLHVVGGNVGKWVAIRMSDGGSDGIPYDSRREAIKHQLHEQYCCYIQVTPDGITPADALRFVLINRALYDAGFRLSDPDMPGEPIYPQTDVEFARIIRGGHV